MVSVQVRDKYGHVLPKPYPKRQDLALYPFSAVHQDDLTLTLDGYGRETPVLGRSGGTRPQECDRKLDRPYLLLKTVIVLVSRL